MQTWEAISSPTLSAFARRNGERASGPEVREGSRRETTRAFAEKGEGPRGSWSGQRDSNSRPQAWEACTLPLSYARFRGSRWGDEARVPRGDTASAKLCAVGVGVKGEWPALTFRQRGEGGLSIARPSSAIPRPGMPRRSAPLERDALCAHKARVSGAPHSCFRGQSGIGCSRSTSRPSSSARSRVGGSCRDSSTRSFEASWSRVRAEACWWHAAQKPVAQSEEVSGLRRDRQGCQ